MCLEGRCTLVNHRSLRRQILSDFSVGGEVIGKYFFSEARGGGHPDLKVCTLLPAQLS